MKKKIVVAAILPLISLIASCGGVSSASSVAVSSAPASSSVASSSNAQVGTITEPTEITLWSVTGKSYQTQLTKFVDAFKKVEPNVTIKNEIISGSYPQLLEATKNGFITNEFPDLVQCYPDHVVEYMEYNKVVKLDDYMNNTVYGLTAVEKADYIEKFLEEGTQYPTEGTWSVPWDKSSELVFWNQDKLNGLNLSSIDATINSGKPLNQAYFDKMTWEELFGKLCPAIESYEKTAAADKKLLATGDKKKTKQAIYTYDSDDNLFITLAQQYGYGYTSLDQKTGKASIDFNNDGMKALLTQFNSYWKAGYLQTKGSSGAYTSDLFTTDNALFTVSSTAGGAYNFSTDNPMNVGVARIPQAAGKENASINQGPSLAILNHGDANRKLASWLFWKFITNAQNSLDWCLNTDYMPIRKSNLTATAFVEASDASAQSEKSKERLKALNLSYTQNIIDEVFASPVFKGSSYARSNASSLMTWAMSDKFDATKIDSQFETAVNNVKKYM